MPILLVFWFFDACFNVFDITGDIKNRTDRPGTTHVGLR